MPWTGVHGRKYARTLNAGLRKVLRQDGNSFGEPDVEEILTKLRAVIVGTDTERAAHVAGVALTWQSRQCLSWACRLRVARSR